MRSIVSGGGGGAKTIFKHSFVRRALTQISEFAINEMSDQPCFEESIFFTKDFSDRTFPRQPETVTRVKLKKLNWRRSPHK